VPPGATLREIYKKYREEFSAADLQQYTELEEGIPADEILAELEAIQQKATHKRQTKS
jgi:hypothetical protein